MEWIDVVSSNIAAIGYDPETKTAGAKFNKGGVFNYLNVPPGVFDAWKGASSKGHFFNTHIKGTYASVKVAVSMESAG